MSSLPYIVDHLAHGHAWLTFHEQDKGEVYFKIRKTTPLRKLMEAYCDKQGVAMGSTRFMFDEKRLNPSQTAEQVGLHATGRERVRLLSQSQRRA